MSLSFRFSLAFLLLCVFSVEPSLAQLNAYISGGNSARSVSSGESIVLQGVAQIDGGWASSFADVSLKWEKVSGEGGTWSVFRHNAFSINLTFNAITLNEGDSERSITFRYTATTPNGSSDSEDVTITVYPPGYSVIVLSTETGQATGQATVETGQATGQATQETLVSELPDYPWDPREADLDPEVRRSGSRILCGGGCTANVGDTVTLYFQFRTDTAYIWEQTGGPSVSLSFSGEGGNNQAAFTASSAGTYSFTLRLASVYGHQYEAGTYTVTVVDPSPKVVARPTVFELASNYPNPFNPATMIEYALPQAVDVELTVYNVVGQVVRTLVAEHQSAGRYAVEWDATGLPSGMYFYRLQAGGAFHEVKKMMLLK